jgi:hypothetical protein
MTKRVLYSFAVIGLAAACLYAEPPITAQIPFPFHVGDSVLPAGSYTTSNIGGSGTLLVLRSADGKASVIVLSSAVHPSDGPAQPTLVFNRYEEKYFLSQVWTGSGGSGRQLRQSRHETEMAAAAKRNVQTVVATR